ncbi:IclR family transcriptional regulator [Aeromicrobium alkaliterrae]|uniref:IclR family transcriptional regulator n=1 Tax=Aeromicrobium alkaliterrae TaxID=302168 RepID=A0ABN2JNQ0_9ACTN
MSTADEPQGMLARGLAILVALGNHPEGASVTEIARDVSLPISTVHRLLATEASLSFVSFDPSTKRYRLGFKVFELAHKVSSVASLADAARPTMRELSAATGETVQLAVLSENRTLFLEKVGTPQPIGIRGSVGDSESVHATSTGKVLISGLPDDELDALLTGSAFEAHTANTITDPTRLREHIEQVRAEQYAVADEEFDEGVRAIAVPVRDGRGQLRAALCVSAPAFRTSAETLHGWLTELRAAAAEIGTRLPLSS